LEFSFWRSGMFLLLPTSPRTTLASASLPSSMPTPARSTARATVYHWRGGVEGTGFPIINPGPGGGLRDFQVECRLAIRVNGAGIIQSVTIKHDTLGQWNFSRCAEVIN
jgi:hypothetical protein